MKATHKTSHKRFGIVALVFVCVVINYMHRTNMSVAAPALTDELGIDTVKMGLIFSAFGWTYAALQIPGGSWWMSSAPGSCTR